MNLLKVKLHFARIQMSDLDDKVNQWDHEYLQEQVWELQRDLEKLRKEFDEFKELLTGDGK
jgi:prefoldin subunit 5